MDNFWWIRKRLRKCNQRKAAQPVPIIWCRNDPAVKIELKHVRKPFDSYSSYQRKLINHGFRMLGSGTSSSVWVKGESNRVIKITWREDGWMNYITWAAKEGYLGNFAPQVFSYRNHGNFSVAVVERMSKTFSEDEEHRIIMDLCSYDSQMAKKALDFLAPGVAAFYKKVKEKYWHLDNHAGNWMLRSNGTIAFTDPVYNAANDNVPNRLRLKDLIAA